MSDREWAGSWGRKRYRERGGGQGGGKVVGGGRVGENK